MLISSLQDTCTTLETRALGTIEVEGSPGTLELLIEGDTVLQIQETLWRQLELTNTLPFSVKLEINGRTIINAAPLLPPTTPPIPN